MSPQPIDKYDAPRLLAGQDNRRFHVMIKPAGSTCNLNCVYCFYLSKESLPAGPGAGRMSDETLERFIQQYIAGVTAPEIVFSWQGGEPTLRGLDFFRKVVALQRKYARPSQKIENDLQTNGTLINEEWCAFLKENGFLVGLSIDGPREIHDAYRVTKGGAPTFDRVFRAARLLKKHGVPFNTLTCVHRLNARRPLDVYRFLRREVGSTYLQFIPIVEYKGFELTAPQTGDASKLPRDGEAAARPGHADSIVTDWSVDPDDWGYFLCKIFDEWRSRDLGKVMVNHCETLVSQHLGLGSQLCVYGEICGKGLAVEHDGSVYSCDHYVYPEHRVGNIHDGELSDAVFSRTQVKFGYAKSERLPAYCRQCPYLTDCWGECPKNRIIRTVDGEPGLNYLCRGFRKFFKHAIPEVDRIAADLRTRGVESRARM
ncbi:MAG TPA: anaerobic sulfatase maturase [Candidatus Krumholzibacteria bacterium]|nr:anaerobic sulfatase maturase [Candidatus Krumholzibacteria bacterium]